MSALCLVVFFLLSLGRDSVAEITTVFGSSFKWEKLENTDCCLVSGVRRSTRRSKEEAAYECDYVELGGNNNWHGGSCWSFVRDQNGEYLTCEGGQRSSVAGATCYKRLRECAPNWQDAFGAACKSYKLNSACRAQGDSGTPCLPGLELVGRAFDITKDSSMPSDLVHITGEMLVSSTMSRTEIKDLHGQTFVHPFELRVISQNQLRVSSSAKTYTSLEEYQTDLETEISAKGSYGVVKGSAAVKGAYSVKNALEQQKKFTTWSTKKPKYTVSLKDNLHMSPFLQETLGDRYDAGLPEKVESIAQNLVDKIGTHFIHSVTMGGSIAIEMKSKACAKSTEIAKSVEVETCATLPASLGPSACVSQGVGLGNKNNETDKSKECSLRVNGGDTSHCSAKCGKGSCDGASWARKLDKLSTDSSQFLQPIGFTLKPLTDLPLPRSIDDWGEGRLNNLKAAIRKVVKQKWEDAAKAAQKVSPVECYDADGASAVLPRVLPAVLCLAGVFSTRV